MEDLRRRATAAQRRGTHGTAAKDIMLLLAVCCMGASAVYWWGVQSALLPGNRLVAATFTAIMVLAPPTLTAFLIPWSPAGMLLQKVNGRTWGQMAVLGAAIYLAYYSFQIQWSWWAAQQVVAESGLIWQQVIVGMIGFILIPALLWTPVSSEELEEKLKQAQLVKRYELQTQADIAILQATLLRAQQQAIVGFANLAVDEKRELAGVMRGLIGGLDRTIQEMAGNLNRTTQTVYGGKAGAAFGAPAFADELIEMVDYVAQALEGARMAEAVTSPTAALMPARDVAPRGDPRDDYVESRAHEASVPAHVDSRLQSSIPREAGDATRPRTTPHDAAYLRAARDAFGRRPWTLKQLAAELSLGDTSAGALRDAWIGGGQCRQVNLGRWAFDITEKGDQS